MFWIPVTSIKKIAKKTRWRPFRWAETWASDLNRLVWVSIVLLLYVTLSLRRWIYQFVYWASCKSVQVRMQCLSTWCFTIKLIHRWFSLSRQFSYFSFFLLANKKYHIWLEWLWICTFNSMLYVSVKHASRNTYIIRFLVPYYLLTARKCLWSSFLLFPRCYCRVFFPIMGELFASCVQHVVWKTLLAKYLGFLTDKSVVTLEITSFCSEALILFVNIDNGCSLTQNNL